MKYIINQTAFTGFLSTNETVRVEKTDKRYPKILEALQLPESLQEEEILRILVPVEISIQSVVGHEGFDVIGESVYYQGEKLPHAFEQKILSIIRDGLPLDYFVKFWENLTENSSYAVVYDTGLIDFLDYAELPITEDGCFLAYRGVRNDYYSVSGNISTKVIQGITNEQGQIYNGVGEYIEIRRNSVTENRDIHCHAGSLHIGSMDYAQGWAGGNGRVIVVKVNPKDVVSVPNDCSSQKCRVCKYEVVSDFQGEIKHSVVDEKGEDTIVPDDQKERQAFVNRLATYLDKKVDAGVGELTIRQIQNSFSPIWPTRETVLDGLQELRYTWMEQDGVCVVSLN